MRLIISVILILSSISFVSAQGKFFTKKANITFNSSTPIEKIEAENKTATFVLDAKTGKLQLAVLIKAFQFEKALMQEHFNENYMESSKFPKATFKGAINNIEDVQLGEDGTYKVNISGTLTIHGAANEVETTGTISVADGAITGRSSFSVLVADYGIEIPKLVRENIAKEVAIDVVALLEVLKK